MKNFDNFKLRIFPNVFSRDPTLSYAIARIFASNAILFLTGNCSGDDWIACLRNKSA
jgi:hypothetical protein